MDERNPIELIEDELDEVTGGNPPSPTPPKTSTLHPTKVTTPDIKLGISYSDGPEWANP